MQELANRYGELYLSVVYCNITFSRSSWFCRRTKFMAILYDLKTGYPDINLVPRERLIEITADVLRSGRGWQYGGDLQGTLATRIPQAAFLTEASGVSVTPDDVMITAGALTAIDIIC